MMAAQALVAEESTFVHREKTAKVNSRLAPSGMSA